MYSASTVSIGLRSSGEQSPNYVYYTNNRSEDLEISMRFESRDVCSYFERNRILFHQSTTGLGHGEFSVHINSAKYSAEKGSSLEIRSTIGETIINWTVSLNAFRISLLRNSYTHCLLVSKGVLAKVRERRRMLGAPRLIDWFLVTFLGEMGGVWSEMV